MCKNFVLQSKDTDTEWMNRKCLANCNIHVCNNLTPRHNLAPINLIYLSRLSSFVRIRFQNFKINIDSMKNGTSLPKFIGTMQVPGIRRAFSLPKNIPGVLW